MARRNLPAPRHHLGGARCPAPSVADVDAFPSLVGQIPQQDDRATARHVLARPPRCAPRDSSAAKYFRARACAGPRHWAHHRAQRSASPRCPSDGQRKDVPPGFLPTSCRRSPAPPAGSPGDDLGDSPGSVLDALERGQSGPARRRDRRQVELGARRRPGIPSVPIITPSGSTSSSSLKVTSRASASTTSSGTW